MATVLNVKTSDSEGHSVTYNIDNPQSIPNPLTRASIAAAFQYGIDNNILMSSYGLPIQNIDQIAYTTSEKVIVQGEPVYISPDNVTMTLTSLHQATTKTTTVSNAQIQAATLIFNEDPPGCYFEVVINNNPTQNNGTVTTSLYVQSTSGLIADKTYTGTLRIVIAGKNYPIQVSIINNISA